MLRRITCFSTLPSPSLFFRHLPRSYSSISGQNLHQFSTSTTLRCICSNSSSDIISEHPPFVRFYKDGRIERLSGTETVPASLIPQNDVVSKDVVYSPEHNLSVRLFLPHKITDSNKKLPLLIYIHGGAWIVGSPFSPIYHNFLTEVVRSANCLAVSIQYRRAPEHPVPAPYDDSWSAMQWIYTHSEDWINEYADFNRVYIAGDSAGGNMSHHMAMRAGEEKLKPQIKGTVIVHPAFWGKAPIDEDDVQDKEIRNGVAEVWEKLVYPNSEKGVDDPWINVIGSGSDFSKLGCDKVLVAVASKDLFWRQGLAYVAKLKSEWKGDVEVMEDDEEHCFHLLNTNSDKIPNFMKKFVNFITAS